MIMLEYKSIERILCLLTQRFLIYINNHLPIFFESFFY